jgi:hypothetical protein
MASTPACLEIFGKKPQIERGDKVFGVEDKVCAHTLYLLLSGHSLGSKQRVRKQVDSSVDSKG